MANDVIIINQDVEPAILVLNEGTQGPKGEPGIDSSVPGPQGIQGIPGEKGEQGLPGASSLGSKTQVYELYGSNIGGDDINNPWLAPTTKLLRADNTGVFLPLNSLSFVDISIFAINPTTGTKCIGVVQQSAKIVAGVGADFSTAYLGIDMNAIPADPYTQLLVLNVEDTNIVINLKDSNGNQGRPDIDLVTGELSFHVYACKYDVLDVDGGSFDWYAKLTVTSLIKA